MKSLKSGKKNLMVKKYNSEHIQRWDIHNPFNWRDLEVLSHRPDAELILILAKDYDELETHYIEEIIKLSKKLKRADARIELLLSTLEKHGYCLECSGINTHHKGCYSGPGPWND